MAGDMLHHPQYMMVVFRLNVSVVPSLKNKPSKRGIWTPKKTTVQCLNASMLSGDGAQHNSRSLDRRVH